MLFKVDENLPLAVRDVQRAGGHDASTVFDQGLVGQLDRRIADICRTEGRAIVTLDKDFADVRTFPPEDYAGLVVLRTTLQGKAAIMRVFSAVIPLLGTEPLAGCLWIVEDTRVRVRKGHTP